MIKRENDGFWIDMQEVVAASHAEIMGCFATADGLRRWFPVNARIDPRPGGEIVLGWDDQFKHTTTIVIVEFDPAGRLVRDGYAAESEPHPRLNWTTSTDLDEGTLIRLEQGPFSDDVESLVRMAEEAGSWRWHLCNLRSVLEVQHDMRRLRPL